MNYCYHIPFLFLKGLKLAGMKEPKFDDFETGSSRSEMRTH
jgi:hypothetical protein